MTLNPTEYDVIQDGRLDGLETIVTPSYEPPEDTEYSFPVVGQGINSQQFQQMNLAMGDGVLITDDSELPYVLEGHGSDAETNSKNTMILKVAKNTGRGEAVIRGFYHTLLADMELSFPAVTTTAVYVVALTYDPRREDEPQGPIRVEVHSRGIPRTFGRKHIVLHTVRRKPNQLLSEAEITTERRYVSPVITVSGGKEGLPDATDVLYGTFGVSRSRTSGGSVISGTGQLFEARGIHGWHNLLKGEWESLPVSTGNGWSGDARARRRDGGYDVYFNIKGPGASDDRLKMFSLPSSFNLTESYYTTVFTTAGPASMEVDKTGLVRLFRVPGSLGWVRGHVYIPDIYAKD